MIANTMLITALKLSLNSGKAAWINVVGKSMKPLLHKDYKIQVEKKQAYEKGDLIVFIKGDKLIVHRLIIADQRKDYYMTMGDNEVSADDPITYNEILGYVINIKNEKGEVIPFSRYARYHKAALKSSSIMHRWGTKLMGKAESMIKKYMLHLLHPFIRLIPHLIFRISM